MLDYRFPTALQMVLSVAMAEQLGERSTSAKAAYVLYSTWAIPLGMPLKRKWATATGCMAKLWRPAW